MIRAEYEHYESADRQSVAESARSQQSGVGADARIHEMAFHIPIDRVMLEGNLVIPAGAHGTILFSHGSGSSRHCPRNRYVADVLQNEIKVSMTVTGTTNLFIRDDCGLLMGLLGAPGATLKSIL